MIHFIWSKGIRLKKYVALGGAMIVCAGLSACGMGEGSSARIPDEDTVKTQEVSQESDKAVDTAETAVDDVTAKTEISEKMVTNVTETPDEDKDVFGENGIYGQTYYNKDLSFRLTAPDDWVVGSEEWLASLGDDVLYLAHAEDDSESVTIMECKDADGTVAGNSRIMKDTEAYCNEVVRQSKNLESCEVDIIEIYGVEYVLTVYHYMDGEYSALFVYGEKDGMYNLTVSVYATERERLKEILYNALSE